MKFSINKKSFKKGGNMANPDFFWFILLSLAGLLIAASFIFGYFLFQKIGNETFIENESGSKTIDTIKKERLDKALEYFSLRKSKSLDILNSPSPVVDPSL